jgi:2-polyprenyl-3-methyl-5-hydroxy-6-metoxy-1,4-benzoquinol methylase
MIRARHFFHPVKSAQGLYRRAEISFHGWLGAREFAKIPRKAVSRCWCGGSLQPLKSAPFYGFCLECGCSVNLNPPVPDSLKNLYSLDGYWRLRQRGLGLPSIEKRAEFYRRDGRIEYWKQLIERFGPPSGQVIEVGCAPGALLTDLAQLGFSCLGVEPDQSVAEWVRRSAGIEVAVGLFPSVEVPSCDLFLAFDVAEHTPDPVGFWTAIPRFLNPGGIAIVQTPIEFHDYANPFKTRRDLLDGLEHLYLYTDKAVRKLAEIAKVDLLAMEDAMGGSLTQFCVLRKSTSPT